jgi:hypothetical protein
MAYADPHQQQANTRHQQWQAEHPRLNRSRLNPGAGLGGLHPVAEPGARTSLIDAKRAEWSRPEPAQPMNLVHAKQAQWQADGSGEGHGRGRTSLLEAKRAQWQTGESYKPTLFC